jgi:hypothetical protein
LTKGELSPSLYGRVDLAAYYLGLKTCRNFIVRPYGGVVNRTGSRFVSEVKDSAKRSRLIPFLFSSDDAFILELGDHVMRVYYRGAVVLDGDEAPVEVATVWAVADLPLLTFTQSGDVMTFCHPDYPIQQLSRYAADDWRFAEFANTEGPFLEINVDQGKTIKSNNYSGNVTLTATGWTFTPDMVGQMIRVEMSPDSITKAWEVQTVVWVNEIRKAGDSYYQALNGTIAGLEVKTGTVRPTVTEGVEADGSPGITWKYLHSGFGIVRITGYTSPTEVTGVVLSRLPDSVCAGTISRAITGVDPGSPETSGGGDPPSTIPMVNAVITAPAHGFYNGDSVTINGLVGIDGLNGVTAQIIVNDVNSFQLSGVYGTGVYVSGGTATKTLSGSPTYKFALEAWGGDQGYPAASSYYQQRQVFAGTKAKPQTVWMSRSAGFTDFGTSVPLLDDDAVSIELAAERRNVVRHLIRLTKLMALTSEAAWVIEKKTGDPLPNTDPQEEAGIHPAIRPLKVASKIIFVENKANVIRSLGYSYSSDSYEGEDLTVTASHLFTGRTVVDWAYQRAPYRCAWVVMSDGALLGITYMPDQQVSGWHRHDTDGLYESVTVVPEETEDVLYAIVRRNVGGVWKRYIERFATRQFTDVKDGFFLDSGLSYDGRDAGAGVSFTLTGGAAWGYEETLTFTTTAPFFAGASDEGDAIVLQDANGEDLRLRILNFISATVVTVLPNRTVPAEFRGALRTGFDVARDTFTGLGHLEGREVSILADGNVEAPAVVQGGAVTLPYPATVVHMGLAYVSDIETLDVNVQGQSLQDKTKNVRSVTLIVEKTRGLQAGPDENNLLDLSPLSSGGYDSPIAEETGPVKANVISDWSDGGRVLFRQANPLPASILAIIPEVQVGGA